MARRKYNKKAYCVCKNINSFARDKLSPNPTESLQIFGIIGKIIGVIFNEIIISVVKVMAFAITGLFYNNKKDHPLKGTIMYTCFFLLLMFGAAGIVSLIV